jgi:histidinol dehydrogenase
MKMLYANSRNFDRSLDVLLLKRKNKVQLNLVSVTKIIKDVKKNGE